jgi:anaerobic ribonucleoside-triphosphate reductase activating protein
MGDTMRYSGIIRNDLAAAPGVSVTFFTQGCPHRCKGCHNPETWDFEGGKEFTHKTLEEIYEALRANGVARSFCVMGGEPLCNENLFLTLLVLKEVRQHFPQVKIYLWTGYYYDELVRSTNSHMKQVLDLIDILIDGPYIEAKRDITLQMRGSSNQSVINLKEKRDEGKDK